MGAQVHHAGGAEESSQGDRELLTISISRQPGALSEFSAAHVQDPGLNLPQTEFPS